MKNNFNKIYLEIISNHNQENIIDEGNFLHLLQKAGSKVLTSKAARKALVKGTKVVGKAAAKGAVNAAKNPKVRKAVVKGIAKAKKITKDTLIKLAKDPRTYEYLIDGIINYDEYKDEVMTAYNLIKDYTNGTYKDISPESVINVGTAVYNVCNSKEKQNSEEIKLGIESAKEELEKYKQWKKENNLISDNQKEQKSENNKDFEKNQLAQNLNPAFESKNLKLNKPLITEENLLFYRKYYSIIFEEANTPDKKVQVIKQIDQEFANDLKKAVKGDKNIKFDKDKTEKIEKVIKNEKISSKINEIKQNALSKKNDDKSKNIALEKIEDQESVAMIVIKEIFSKETLLSLIPFNTKPTLEDMSNFFSSIHAVNKKEYSYNEEDWGNVIAIATSLGVIIVKLYGALAGSAVGTALGLPTFGISAVTRMGICCFINFINCR